MASFPSSTFPLSRLAAAIGLLSAGAHATNVEVSNLDDDGPGSLRQAMVTAEIDVDTDPSVISFAAGLSGTINLQSPLALITEDLTINGSGIVLNAAAATGGAALSFTPGEPDQVLSLNDISVRNAPAGALYSSLNSGSAVELDRVTIADGSGGRAVKVNSGDLTLRESVISGNSDGDDGSGAAIYVKEGSVQIEDTRIVDNDRGSSDAGGLRIFDGDGQIIDSVISGNTSGDDGGGVAVIKSSLTITQSQVEGNTAGTIDDRAYGGGLFLDGGNATIEGSRITGNTGSFGGGIGVDSGYGESDLEIYDSAITDNRTSFWGGGGIGVAGDDVAITLTRSTVSGNSTDESNDREGGGIYFTSEGGSLELNDSIVSGNSTAGTGGAVFSGEAGRISLNQSRVEGNSAATGGAFYLSDIGGYGGLLITRSIIANNSASERFSIGKVTLSEDSLTIDESTISGHQAGAASGAGLQVEVDYNSSVAVSNSTFSGNTAEGPVLLVDGSAVSMGSGDTVLIENSTFSGNRATASQSALLFREVEVDISHSTFVDNAATLPGGFSADTAQLSVHGGTAGEGSLASLELSQSVLTSGNVDELVVGGDAIIDGATVSQGGMVNAMLDQLVLVQGFSSSGGGTVNLGSGLPSTANPLLGALADRGGFTRVHEPMQGSPVIDAGNEGMRPADRDQRGLAGTVQLNTDLGAVEVSSNNPPRLVSNLPGDLGGVLGDEVDIADVATAFVDDDGDTVSVVSVAGLPAGLTFDGTGISGTLEGVGETSLTVIVEDDATQSLQTAVQAKVTVTAEPPSGGGGGGGSVPVGVTALFAFLALLRRRRQ